MDPLSDVVSLLRPDRCVAAGLDAGGEWSVGFDRHAGLKCNAVLEGACWLRVDGVPQPLRMDAGDCMILPHGAPFVLSSRRLAPAERAAAHYVPVPHGRVATYGEGGDFFMTGSRFLMAGPAAAVLLGALPPVIPVRSSHSADTVGWALRRMAEELRSGRPGAAALTGHLAHIVFVEALRCHLRTDAALPSGWLAAMADPALSGALSAMHADPAAPWTVESLATAAGMSRTAFAVRFSRVAGQGPIAYLTRFRMLLAADRLSRPGSSAARIAAEVGYASESAFNAAFKRTMGVPPRRYVRGRSTRPDTASR